MKAKVEDWHGKRVLVVGVFELRTYARAVFDLVVHKKVDLVEVTHRGWALVHIIQAVPRLHTSIEENERLPIGELALQLYPPREKGK